MGTCICMYTTRQYLSITTHEDTVLAQEAIDDVQDPLGMNGSLKLLQHVVVPDELAAGRGEGARVGPHLALEREGEVV